MLEHSPSMERLIEAFRRLPGIGRRSAERLAIHLLCAPQQDAQTLSEAISQARERVSRCSTCADLTEQQPCSICIDSKRDRAIICVVERPAGVTALEKGGSYRGLYHVLHGALSPLDGIGPSELTVASLLKRIDAGGVSEVILATNATTEGEATALYLSRILHQRDVIVSRIAHGVPMGGGLEYADHATLDHAMQGRGRF